MSKLKKRYREGKVKGMIVEDYPKGEDRPYMTTKYGGRIVARDLSEKDLANILVSLNYYEKAKIG